METKKSILIGTIVIILLLSGCIASKPNYVGTYYKDNNNYLQLKSDGTFIIIQDARYGSYTGTYEIVETNSASNPATFISLKFGVGGAIMKVDKGMLVDSDGEKWILK
jgi:hypothetical protein